MNRARRLYPGTKEMRANITFTEIAEQLYNIFSDDRRADSYKSDRGEMYDMFSGWAGPMSPANRPAFVNTFGQDVTDRAEAEARARVDEYRAAVAASAYHCHVLDADAFAVAYGTPEKSQVPEVGAFVWCLTNWMKCENGPADPLRDFAEGGELGEFRRVLVEIVAAVDLPAAEFLTAEAAHRVAADHQETGGSRYEEADPLRLDGQPMAWTTGVLVRCGARWYVVDSEGYDWARYILMPDNMADMYTPELADIRAAYEAREAEKAAEAQRQADARRADYLARCARWSSIMEDVRPLIEAERAAYGSREKSQIRKASAKLAAARRRNLVAMASALYPGVKFSAKKWDGWGGSYELTWTDGPTEEHLQEAGDFDLFESSRDVFNGYDDSSDVIRAEFVDFADKYFDLGGQINFRREVSDEIRHSIADRIREAVPGLSASEMKPITDDGQQSAICGMFRDVEGVELSFLCNHLEKGLFFAVSYLARCMDATPAHQDEPTDPNGGGSPAPSYGDCEKSQLQDAPTVEGVEVVGYSEKALAVFGDTRALADELKAIGAKFNRALLYNGERRAGWIISRRKADELAAVLAVPQGQEEEPQAEGWEQYNGVSWNPADLTGCKQAARILIRDGAPFADLSALNFGNLDLFAVWEEEHPDAVAELDRWADIPEEEEHPEDEPTDPDTPDGGGEPSRPRYRHRYLPDTEPAAPALPEPPAAVVYDPAQPIDRAEFVAVDADGAPYGMPEKSQILEAVEVTENPDVKEYRLMYLFGAWVCHSRVYAETDGEAIEDATDDYLTSTLPRWPYRVALWDGSRLVHEFKGDGPDDIGRRDMEQENSMFFPVYKVLDASLEASDPSRYYSAVSLLKAADRVTNNEHTASPHHLQILCDGLKIWDSEENTKLHLVDIVRQRLAMPYGDAEKSQIQETMRAEAQREEICDWYCYEYPTDEEGAKIRAGVTFADIMAHPEKIYNYIPSDSILRERVFRETANRYGVEYSKIYSRWLDGGKDSPTLPYGDAEKSPVPDHLADIYQRAKAKSAEAVALFHCGDWFTAYAADADRVADAVGIIITTTRDGFRKASFPFAALDTYLPRMVRQGMKVCICDAPRQAEPSRLEKVAQEV